MFRIGNPHFCSVQNVIIALFLRRSFQGERVAARRRFRETETADLEAKMFVSRFLVVERREEKEANSNEIFRQSRKIMLFLLFSSIIEK